MVTERGKKGQLVSRHDYQMGFTIVSAAGLN